MSASEFTSQNRVHTDLKTPPQARLAFEEASMEWLDSDPLKDVCEFAGVLVLAADAFDASMKGCSSAVWCEVLERIRLKLRSSNSRLRLRFAYCLLSAGLDRDESRSVLQELCHDEDMACRMNAAFTLVRFFGKAEAQDGLPALRECCRFRSSQLSYSAATRCAQLDPDGPGGQEAVPVLWELLTSTSDQFTRLVSAVCLARVLRSKAQMLIPLLRSIVEELVNESGPWRFENTVKAAILAVGGLKLIGKPAATAVPSVIALTHAIKRLRRSLNDEEQAYDALAKVVHVTLQKLIVGSGRKIDDEFLCALLAAPMLPPEWAWTLLNYQRCREFIDKDLLPLVSALKVRQGIRKSPLSLVEEIKPEIVLTLQKVVDAFDRVAPFDYARILPEFDSRCRGRVEYYLEQTYLPARHRRRRRATDKVAPWTERPSKTIIVYERPTEHLLNVRARHQDDMVNEIALREAQAELLELVRRTAQRTSHQVILQILSSPKSRGEIAANLGLTYEQVRYAFKKLASQVPDDLRLSADSIAAFAEILRRGFAVGLTPRTEAED